MNLNPISSLAMMMNLSLMRNWLITLYCLSMIQMLFLMPRYST